MRFEELVIAGMMTHMCGDATRGAAADSLQVLAGERRLRDPALSFAGTTSPPITCSARFLAALSALRDREAGRELAAD